VVGFTNLEIFVKDFENNLEIETAKILLLEGYQECGKLNEKKLKRPAFRSESGKSGNLKIYNQISGEYTLVVKKKDFYDYC
jgi:hypothetical protein